jgi:hypothetical protein
LLTEKLQRLTRVESDAKTHRTPKAFCAKFVPTAGASFCELFGVHARRGESLSVSIHQL